LNTLNPKFCYWQFSQITLLLLFGFQRPAPQPKTALQPDGQHTQIGFDCQQLFSEVTIFFCEPTFFKRATRRTKLLSQKGLAFYHKQFQLVKIKMMIGEKK
jgi:hypothetical protein